jgi:hypothetical protein
MNVTDKVLDLASRLQRRPTVGRIYRLRSTELLGPGPILASEPRATMLVGTLPAANSDDRLAQPCLGCGVRLISRSSDRAL